MDYEAEKENLRDNVAYCIKELQRESTTFDDKVPFRSGRLVLQMCGAIELVLRHGLSSSWRNAFSSNPSFWVVATRITRKDVPQLLKTFKHCNSDHAKVRAWIRLAVNEQSLESYVAVLAQDEDTLSTFYEPWAYLRDGDQMSQLLGLLAGMSFTMEFDLILDDQSLEYEPTPVANTSAVVVANTNTPAAVVAVPPKVVDPSMEGAIRITENLGVVVPEDLAVVAARVPKKKHKKKKKKSSHHIDIHGGSGKPTSSNVDIVSNIVGGGVEMNQRATMSSVSDYMSVPDQHSPPISSTPITQPSTPISQPSTPTTPASYETNSIMENEKEQNINRNVALSVPEQSSLPVERWPTTSTPSTPSTPSTTSTLSSYPLNNGVVNIESKTIAPERENHSGVPSKLSLQRLATSIPSTPASYPPTNDRIDEGDVDVGGVVVADVDGVGVVGGGGGVVVGGGGGVHNTGSEQIHSVAPSVSDQNSSSDQTTLLSAPHTPAVYKPHRGDLDVLANIVHEDDITLAHLKKSTSPTTTTDKVNTVSNVKGSTHIDQPTVIDQNKHTQLDSTSSSPSSKKINGAETTEEEVHDSINTMPADEHKEVMTTQLQKQTTTHSDGDDESVVAAEGRDTFELMLSKRQSLGLANSEDSAFQENKPVDEHNDDDDLDASALASSNELTRMLEMLSVSTSVDDDSQTQTTSDGGDTSGLVCADVVGNSTSNTNTDSTSENDLRRRLDHVVPLSSLSGGFISHERWDAGAMSWEECSSIVSKCGDKSFLVVLGRDTQSSSSIVTDDLDDEDLSYGDRWLCISDRGKPTKFIFHQVQDQYEFDGKTFPTVDAAIQALRCGVARLYSVGTRRLLTLKTAAQDHDAWFETTSFGVGSQQPKETITDPTDDPAPRLVTDSDDDDDDVELLQESLADLQDHTPGSDHADVSSTSTTTTTSTSTSTAATAATTASTRSNSSTTLAHHTHNSPTRAPHHHHHITAPSTRNRHKNPSSYSNSSNSTNDNNNNNNNNNNNYNTTNINNSNNNTTSSHNNSSNNNISNNTNTGNTNNNDNNNKNNITTTNDTTSTNNNYNGDNTTDNNNNNTRHHHNNNNNNNNNNNKNKRDNRDRGNSSASEADDVPGFVLIDNYFDGGAESFKVTELEYCVDDLQREIDIRVETIKSVGPEDPEAKRLVEDIVNLRHRYQQAKEELSGAVKFLAENSVVIEENGHKFQIHPAKHPPENCDACQKTIKTKTVYNPLKPLKPRAYRCMLCNFTVHRNCLAGNRRSCLSSSVLNAGIETRICPDRGLGSQEYKCSDCGAGIGFQGGVFAQARICDYLGVYFCPACHKGDKEIVPARVLHNWDFERKAVSQRAKETLAILHDRPTIDLQVCNKLLLNHVEEIMEFTRTRRSLKVMTKFLSRCRVASMQPEMLKELSSRPHLYLSENIYSIKDLIQVQDGTIQAIAGEVRKQCEDHIRGCFYCSAKGSYCELCSEGDLIFPFDNNVIQCKECKTLFHDRCFDINVGCPKCLRIVERKHERELEDDKLHQLTTATDA